MRLLQTSVSEAAVELLATCAITTLIGLGIYSVIKPYKQTLPPISTSLTFTQTNRLVVTHYVIIPATLEQWSAMTSRYPANVTRTTLRFE